MTFQELYNLSLGAKLHLKGPMLTSYWMMLITGTKIIRYRCV